MRTPGRTRELDRAVARLAEAQHGVVGRDQLLDLGLGKGAIGRRLRAGRLHRVHPGVYAVGHRALSLRGRWSAALLFAGPGAVLSHRSAAAFWGFRSDSGGAIHLTAPRRARRHGTLRRHHALLAPDEAVREDGIAVTTVPRTILDLAAAGADAHQIEAALRRCEYLRLYDSLSLWDLLRRHRGHRGSRACRTALLRLGQAPGEVEEGIEELFLAFLDAHGLPRGELNAELEAGGRRYRADCLWRRVGLVAELDSWSAHGTRAAFHADKRRDRHLRVAGYTTIRITWQQLHAEPAELAADLRLLLTPDKRP